MKPSTGLRFALAATLIAGTAILLQARSRTETVPQRLPLVSFPAQLANWPSTEIVQDKKTLEVLGSGDFLERVYQDPQKKLPDVDVFLAYFPSQRAGETPHSPQHCLPGAGWNPEETPASHCHCRATPRSQPIDTSSRRVTIVASYCIGFGRMIAVLPASTGPSSIS